MPTIEYSPGMANVMYTNMLNVNSSTANSYSEFRFGSTPIAIALYSGTVATALQGSTTTDSANVLCAWYGAGSTFNEGYNFPYQSFNASTLIWTITTTYRQAQNTGLATHFRLFSRSSSGNDWPLSTAYTVYGQIVGTVGIVGSGADLEMGNTSIVANRRYRIQNLQIQFPRTFTY